MRKRITCNFALEPKCMNFLKERSAIHLSQDWSMLQGLRRRDPRHGFSAHYAMAYSALKEFALAGTSIGPFHEAIGAIALVSSSTSQQSLQYLCDIVAKETGEALPLGDFHVDSFEIFNGSCVVITMPPPQVEADAYMVGIVTDAPLDKPTTEKGSRRAIVHYFSLERADSGLPILCGWKLALGPSRKNYGIRVNPTVEEFVDAAEQLWVSGKWKIDEDKSTALHAAAEAGQADAVVALLAAGKPADSRDEKDITPLHLAAGGGHETIVEALLDKGANVNAVAKNMTRPLHWAAAKGHERVVELLIAHGADISAGDFFGFTALDAAERNKHKAVVDLLRSRGTK